MADPTKGRRPAYLDRYARTLAAVYRVEAIEAAVQREQDRIQYLDSLIATERQTLTALADAFRVPPQDFGTAKKLIEQELALRGMGVQAREAAQAAAVRASTVPAQERAEFFGLLRTNQKAQAANKALQLIQQYPGAAAKVLEDVEASAVRFKEGDLAAIRQAAAQARAPATGVPRQMQEQLAAAQEQRDEALEAAFMAGPSGIRGGFAGQRVVELRELTATQLRERAEASEDETQAKLLEARAKALDESEFATGADALNAALTVVRETGDPSQVAEGLARDVYEEARNAQAYRNDQRADFEQDVLDSRRRLAALELEKTRLAGAYDDPRQEVLRRDLRARGYKVEDPYVLVDGEYQTNPQAWRNAYLRYQNTPEHAYYIGAHERTDKALSEDKPLAPSTRAENLAVSFTMMRDRRGEDTTPQQLADQLQKAGIKGKELEDAVSFTMAYWELGGPAQDPETIRLRKEADAQQKQEEKARRDAAQRAADEAKEAREALARQEAAATRATQEFREARTAREDARRIYAQEYQRQRVLGKSPEEAARSATSRVQQEAPEAPTAPVEVPRIVSQQLGGPEALVARQAPVTRAPMQVEGMTIRAERPTFEEAAVRVQDPTAPEYSYARTDDGFKVFRGDVETGIARPGTTAFRSIERTLAGGQPLPPPAPAPAPVAKREPDGRLVMEEEQITARAPAAPAPAAPAELPDFSKMTDEELRRMAGMQ